MLGKSYVWVRGRSDDGQVVRLSSGEGQVTVKSQKYSELDISGQETCFSFLIFHSLDRFDQ